MGFEVGFRIAGTDVAVLVAVENLNFVGVGVIGAGLVVGCGIAPQADT